jgi:uncharacterized membrane protein
MTTDMWMWQGVGHAAAGGWWIVFPILWLVFWVVVVGLAVWLSRSAIGQRDRGPQDPVEILRRRLAAGEITEQQYNDVLKVLKG